MAVREEGCHSLMSVCLTGGTGGGLEMLMEPDQTAAGHFSTRGLMESKRQSESERRTQKSIGHFRFNPTLVSVYYLGERNIHEYPSVEKSTTI